MARGLDGATQYLRIDPTPVLAAPLTMACWFYTTDDTAYQMLMASNEDLAGRFDRFHLTAQGSVAGDPLGANTQDGASGGNALTSTGFSINTWHHACGVFAAANSRAVYLDGGGKGTDATNVVPTSLDRFSIGADWRSDGDGLPRFFLNGGVAEAAVWNVALTDAEVLILAAGYRPTFVRPDGLVAYWPLIWNDRDRWGDTLYPLVDMGGPPKVDHVPIRYSINPYVGYPSIADDVIIRTLPTTGAGR